MKIIKKGKVYRQECPNCGCVYEYSAKDIDDYSCTRCPECNEVNNHSKENEWS